MENSKKNNTLKYILLEAGIVIVFLLVAAVIIVNPLQYIARLPQGDNLPINEMTSATPDGKKVKITVPASTPESIMVYITDTGFSPQAASGSARGTVITYVNNANGAITLNFSDNILPQMKLPSQDSWTSASIAKKGTFTTTIEETGATGTITLE